MAVKTEMLPEDVVIATLNRVGKGVRLVDDHRLAKIFDDASKNGEGPFRDFRLYPRYEFSRLLSETLQVLDLAGSIRRENAAQRYFGPSEHTLGEYGKSKYDQLEAAERAAVDKVANQIKQIFASSNEPR
jgi:hypothetical protein